MKETHQVVVHCGLVSDLTASTADREHLYWKEPFPSNPSDPALCKNLAGEGTNFGLWLSGNTHRSFLRAVLEVLQEQADAEKRRSKKA